VNVICVLFLGLQVPFVNIFPIEAHALMEN
jgi:hypothetical protein